MTGDAAAAHKAVRMLDLLEDYFHGGEYWIKGAFHDGDGRSCLVGAMQRLRVKHKLYGDATRYYLLHAFDRECRRLTDCNDLCETWPILVGTLHLARRLAEADIAERGPLLLRAA
jgi:hypothetical protein